MTCAQAVPGNPGQRLHLFSREALCCYRIPLPPPTSIREAARVRGDRLINMIPIADSRPGRPLIHKSPRYRMNYFRYSSYLSFLGDLAGRALLDGRLKLGGRKRTSMSKCRQEKQGIAGVPGNLSSGNWLCLRKRARSAV